MNINDELINNSFLRNVPALVESGLSIDEAIQQAFEADNFDLLPKLYNAAQGRSGRTDEYTECVQMFSDKLHARFNQS